MEDNVYFKHDFIKTALTGVIASFDEVFKPYLTHLNNDVFPIFINNTGDEVYLSNMHNIGKGGVEHYEHVPRMSMALGGFNVQADQLTAPANIAFLQVEKSGMKRDAMSHLRRIPIVTILRAELVFSKVHEVLTFIEYYLSVLSHSAITFDIVHGGTVHQIAVNTVFDFEKEINTALSFSADKRGITLPMNFEVEMQFPAYNLYKPETLNFFEEPGVILTDNTAASNSRIFGNDEDIPNCSDDSCGDCKSCKDKRSGRGMIKIIHNTHINNPKPAGKVSTQIITK